MPIPVSLTQRSLRVAGRSPRTIQSYTESVTQLAAHADVGDPQQLDRAAISAYLDELAATKSPATVRGPQRVRHPAAPRGELPAVGRGEEA
jgi:hypothetical protein